MKDEAVRALQNYGVHFIWNVDNSDTYDTYSYRGGDKVTGINLREIASPMNERCQAWLATLDDALHLYAQSELVTDESLAFCSQLPQLEMADFSDSKVRGTGLRYLAGLPRLSTVVLRNTPVDDEALAIARDFGNLSHLILIGTNVTNDGASSLSSIATLKYLALSATDVSDSCLESLSSLPALQTLILQDTNVSQEGVESFVRKRPDVHIIR